MPTTLRQMAGNLPFRGIVFAIKVPLKQLGLGLGLGLAPYLSPYGYPNDVPGGQKSVKDKKKRLSRKKGFVRTSRGHPKKLR